MDLSNFYLSIQKLLAEIAAKKINKIALVIQPTQYKNNFVWEDHIFKINSMLADKYEIEMSEKEISFDNIYPEPEFILALQNACIYYLENKNG